MSRNTIIVLICHRHKLLYLISMELVTYERRVTVGEFGDYGSMSWKPLSETVVLFQLGLSILGACKS
jgi:hypothetical protein